MAEQKKEGELMKIGYVQTSPVFGDKEKNFEEVRRLTRGVNADLLVLPELFGSGYAFTSREEAEALAEIADGPTAAVLKELSLQTGAVVVAGYIEKDRGHLYNAALVVSGNCVIDSYRKIHLFNKEKLWFEAGDKPLQVFNINDVKIGVMVCFDWMFPEVCRTMALQGMQVLAHPSNLVMPWCQRAMVTRCLENRIFAVTANRTGEENRGGDHFVFTGASQITAADGSVLSSAPASESCLAVVEVDVKQAGDKNINAYNNVIADRRTEFYVL